MKKFKIIYLLLSSVFFANFCNAQKDILQKTDISKLIILDDNYNSMLFKTGVKFFNKYFSGLVLIKNNNADTAIHVIFMTEFGLTLLDLKYKNDDFNVVTENNFFANELIVDAMKENFRIILQNLTYINEFDIRQLKDGKSKITFSHLSNKYSYFCNSSFKVNKIKYRKDIFKTIKVKISRNENMEPNNILFNRKLINLSIDLNLLKISKNEIN